MTRASVKRGLTALVLGLSMLTTSAGAWCPPFYEREDLMGWPVQYDTRAVEMRLSRQLLEIQRGLGIGQIPMWQAQGLLREHAWLRAMARRYQSQPTVTPQQWQALDWNLTYAWRHIQQARRDCGY